MPKPQKKTSSPVLNPEKGLVIGKPQHKVLSKPQQTFNRLVKKIERLQKEIIDNNRILGEKLEYYGQHIHPLELQITELRKQIVKLLFPFYTAKKPLTKRDKHVLKEILITQINNIFALDKEEPDEELQTIFQEIEGISLAEAEKQDMELMKSQMTEIFQSFGFQMNFDDLGPNMDEEDLMRKMQEMADQVKEQAGNFENRNATRRKTKKQLEKEEREKQAAEIKNKSISRIYKQLAKVLHPDLEQDTEQKAYKEVRMRELTAAYEKNDLHTLLRLEIEWLQKEESNLEQLTNEKLEIYNQVLKEQAADLDEEVLRQLEHPRYQPLFRFTMFPAGLKWINMPEQKKEIAASLKSLQKSISRLEGENPLNEVKEVISYFRNVY